MMGSAVLVKSKFPMSLRNKSIFFSTVPAWECPVCPVGTSLIGILPTKIIPSVCVTMVFSRIILQKLDWLSAMIRLGCPILFIMADKARETELVSVLSSRRSVVCFVRLQTHTRMKQDICL